MPNSDSWPKIDEVALAYGRHGPELNAARARFKDCAARVCDHLVGLAEDAAGKAGLVVLPSKRVKPEPELRLGIWGNLWIDGAFANKLAASQKEEYSGFGFGFGFGEYWGDRRDIPFGLYPYLSFHGVLGADGVRRDLPARCGLALESRGARNDVFLVANPLEIDGGALVAEQVRNTVDGLVDAFKVVDQVLADAVRGKP